MADAEMQTFTSIMDALVRINVSIFALPVAHFPHYLLFACSCYSTLGFATKALGVSGHVINRILCISAEMQT